MKGRDILKGLTEARTTPRPSARTGPPKATGTVGALKSELDNIAEEAAAARALRETIAREGQIVELDPRSVDGASISDRIPFDQDPEYESLKRAIEKSEQQVPILVRPHPNVAGRYQAAYGHRRLRAATELGRKVKAIVHNLSDEEMVLAQGQENGPRQDLSFVERALYASKLAVHGYDREVICLALSVDKPEVSRLLQVAEGIETRVIMAIGPARKIGRPRWITLAKAIADRKAQNRIDGLLTDPSFIGEADSNKRFALVLAATQSKKDQKGQSKAAIKAVSGKRVGWVQPNKTGTTIIVDDQGFSEFLQSKLPDLIAEFEEKSDDA